ncbi:MAG: GHKL domain-containing protein [Oscillospiraceae bacterium]|nr:GHKL domain-containing protein [Oscillospiraceae bacterium]
MIENQLLATNHTEFQTMFNKTVTIISIFLLIFIIGSLVFNCISRAYFENVSSILEKQVNEQVDYYKKIDKIDKELRNFRHDYKNHMICVQSLIEAKEYAEATEYLEGITLHKTILSRGFSSGNSIADVLLSDKSEWAEKVGAEIQFEGVIYENIPPADLCTILSNAIDNAIEACEKIQSNEQKIISVKCSYIKRIQFIDITNPVSEDVKITNNVVETSKSDKNIHGIGLYNIRRTVMKYDGEFDISCKDKTFAMSIAFKAD